MLGLLKDWKGLTEAFYGCDGDKKMSWFSDILILKWMVHLQQLKGMQCSKQGTWKG